MPIVKRLLVSLTLSISLQAFAAETTQWQGAPLKDLLDDMNEQGLQIIYSTALVRRELVISSEPDLSDPIAGLRTVLLTFGLILADGPKGSWLVVRQEASPTVEPEAEFASSGELTLPEVIVTSSLHRLAYAHTGTETYLDRDFASRTPAAAEEAVRMTTRLPGTASGGISIRNHVRGGEANEVLFLLDGLRLYEPFHLKDFQSITTTVNSNAIDGLDFYSGAFPARFGDRMSGVISMKLREPEKAIETELALSFFNTSVLSLGRFGGGERGDWLVAARRGNLDLIADIVNPDFGSPAYQDYIVHAGWEFGPRARISANLLASTDSLVLADPDRGERASAEYQNQVLWLKWLADWSSSLSSETILSVSNITGDRSGTLLLPDIVAGSLNEDREFRSIELKQEWTFAPSSEWMLAFGLDAKRLESKYRFESIKSVAPPFDQILDNEPLVIRRFDVAPEGDQYGVFAEIRWQLLPNLILDAGLRWDRQSYTTADEDDQTSPRVSLLYRYNKRTEFRLGWGQYSQAQEINELQISDGVNRFFPAQRAVHVVANVKHRIGRKTNVEISLYRKSFGTVRPRYENVVNSLTLLPEIQFDRVRIDAATAQAQGAELRFSRGSGEEEFFWWLSYTWSEVRDEFPGESVLRAWDQTHAVKAGLSRRWGSWDFNAAGEIHDGWPKTELIGETIVNPDGSRQLQVTATARNSQRYSTFRTLDVRISRNFEVRHGDLTFFVEVTNLVNRNNVCCTEYSVGSAPDGTQVLSAREAHWLPLLPSLGVVWRF